MEKKILIIDDSRTARMFIKQSFEIAGFSQCTFIEASQGKEALEIMNVDSAIILVLTDINMPVMDGISMLREMRNTSTLMNLPVLVISSTQNAAREAELAPYKVEAILAKPLHLPMVLNTLNSIKIRLGI